MINTHRFSHLLFLHLFPYIGIHYDVWLLTLQRKLEGHPQIHLWMTALACVAPVRHAASQALQTMTSLDMPFTLFSFYFTLDWHDEKFDICRSNTSLDSGMNQFIKTHYGRCGRAGEPTIRRFLDRQYQTRYRCADVCLYKCVQVVAASEGYLFIISDL